MKTVRVSRIVNNICQQGNNGRNVMAVHYRLFKFSLERDHAVRRSLLAEFTLTDSQIRVQEHVNSKLSLMRSVFNTMIFVMKLLSLTITRCLFIITFYACAIFPCLKSITITNVLQARWVVEFFLYVEFKSSFGVSVTHGKCISRYPFYNLLSIKTLQTNDNIPRDRESVVRAP